jgi:hypothetical protein
MSRILTTLDRRLAYTTIESPPSRFTDTTAYTEWAARADAYDFDKGEL